MKLDDENRSKLVTVVRLRGLHFVAAEAHLDPETVLAAAKGEECMDLKAKKLRYWLETFVS